MKRLLFNLLAAVSLVLSLVAVGAAVRGIWISDAVMVRSDVSEYVLVSNGGELAFSWGWGTSSPTQSVGPFFEHVRGTSVGYAEMSEELRGPNYRSFARTGYAIFYGPSGRIPVVFAPIWLLCILFAISPAIWLRRHLRQRRLAVVRGFAVEAPVAAVGSGLESPSRADAAGRSTG